jgi:alkanesulfonate monooxygenase SsuD/methylene tetrahydromethanopterin reductase-like flavin-dependent oxidoreductase (luciferase family)
MTPTSQSVSPSERLRSLVEQIERADQIGLDVFGVWEHHRREFLDSAPSVILGAVAARTQRIRLTSAVTILCAADPVRSPAKVRDDEHVHWSGVYRASLNG